MKVSLLSCWLMGLAGESLATAVPFQARAARCPAMHVFGARETTAPPGFGTAEVLISLVQKAFPGTTAEAIDYPAAGGDEYGASVTAGIKGILKQMAEFQRNCPDTVIIMHGYSQVRS